MKLYHGTSEWAAGNAMLEGLKPRCLTNLDSNWEKNPSHPAQIYLTDVYAPYFGYTAATSDQFTKGKGELDNAGQYAVLEIDTDYLDEDDMFPDEDFLEQASRQMDGLNHTKAKTVEGRTRWYKNNIERFKDMWEVSVEHLGTCSHRGPIPRDAISRIAFVPISLGVNWLVVDPSISLLNHKICAAKYRMVTNWIMKDEFDFENYAEAAFMPPPDAMMAKGTAKALKGWREKQKGSVFCLEEQRQIRIAERVRLTANVLESGWKWDSCKIPARYYKVSI